MTQNINFTEMLCTRFCHDIIGPIGAISNGAEFLRDEMPKLESQALDLIENSGKEAIARVQFYRHAYGMAAKSGSASLTEAKELTTKFLRGGKITLNWDDKYTDMSPVSITDTEKKLIFNLIIIITSTLIRGGVITFTISDSGWVLKSEGKGAKLDEKIEATLAGEPQELSPKLVQAIYTQKLAAESNAKINIKKLEDIIEIHVSK